MCPRWLSLTSSQSVEIDNVSSVKCKVMSTTTARCLSSSVYIRASDAKWRFPAWFSQIWRACKLRYAITPFDRDGHPDGQQWHHESSWQRAHPACSVRPQLSFWHCGPWLLAQRSPEPVDSPALDWFQSYISKHSQTFITSNSQSDLVPVKCSVLQGSVLDSVQFIAYTEDAAELFDKHNRGYHMFADDKQLHMHVLPSHEVMGLHCVSKKQPQHF